MSTFQFKTSNNAFLGAIHVMKRLSNDATMRAEERMACNTVMTAMAEFVEQAWADMTWTINGPNYSDPGNFLHAAAGLLHRHQEAKRENHMLRTEALKRRDVPTLSVEHLRRLANLVDRCRELRADVGEIPPSITLVLRKAAVARAEESPASEKGTIPRSPNCLHSMQSHYIDKHGVTGCTDCDDERKGPR